MGARSDSDGPKGFTVGINVDRQGRKGTRSDGFIANTSKNLVCIFVQDSESVFVGDFVMSVSDVDGADWGPFSNL